MISTQTYRGRRIEADNILEKDIESNVAVQGSMGYYSTTRFSLRNLRICDDNAGESILSIAQFKIASRSDRWGSWTAWNECRFFALLGDFVVFCETDSCMIDPSDDLYEMKRMHLVNPATFDASSSELTASMHLLQDYEGFDREQKELPIVQSFSSINHHHYYMPNAQSSISEEFRGSSSVEIQCPVEHLRSCGGAALLMIDGVQRWLIPHPDGPEAALVRVRSTTPTDDWLALQVSMQGPTKAERNQVRAHFLGLDDPELSAKVLEVCGAPEPQADEGA